MMGRIWFFHSLPFRKNGIYTLPRRRMSRKCLQGRRYSVQEEWYLHTTKKKDKQEVFTRSSLSVQEEWYLHASQKKDEQEVFTRSSLSVQEEWYSTHAS
jgi:hypothetical protein